MRLQSLLLCKNEAKTFGTWVELLFYCSDTESSVYRLMFTLWSLSYLYNSAKTKLSSCMLYFLRCPLRVTCVGGWNCTLFLCRSISWLDKLSSLLFDQCDLVHRSEPLNITLAPQQGSKQVKGRATSGDIIKNNNICLNMSVIFFSSSWRVFFHDVYHLFTFLGVDTDQKGLLMCFTGVP